MSIELERVETLKRAKELAFRGSPTVLVDGEDPFLDEDVRSGSPAGSTTPSGAPRARRASASYARPWAPDRRAGGLGMVPAVGSTAEEDSLRAHLDEPGCRRSIGARIAGVLSALRPGSDAAVRCEDRVGLAR